MPDSESIERVHREVRAHYGGGIRAMTGGGCCGEPSAEPSCCGGAADQGTAPEATSCCGPASSCCCGADDATRMGYTPEEIAAAPDVAQLSFGCGNPGAIAALQPGEVVLDLGSGAGFDCFLAARKVGPEGRVIGVDMTHEMLTAARANARRAGFTNVEFRLGEIEHLPVADNSVDVIISNCVVNLSPDKPAVFAEALRVLRPGGRLAISDVVATAPLPDEVKADLALWSCCIGGASLVDDLEAMLREAGFEQVRIRPVDESREMIRKWAPGSHAEDYVLSASIEAVKPAR